MSFPGEVPLKIGRIPDQVVRLAILFILAIGSLLAARHYFIPDSFGKIGHYRADAITEISSLPVHYAGWQVCAGCHDDIVAKKNASYHRTLSCEVCHGPSAKHADDPGETKPIVPRKRGEACLYCHQYLPSRPTGFPQIIEATHNPMEPCVSCHNPHDPKPPSVPELCSACHGEISRTKAISPHARLECTTCHEAAPAHRENPRAYPPKKPTERAFCGKCHAKDAKSSPEIPRVDISDHGGSYLCWQCHYPHHPET